MVGTKILETGVSSSKSSSTINMAQKDILTPLKVNLGLLGSPFQKRVLANISTYTHKINCTMEFPT